MLHHQARKRQEPAINGREEHAAIPRHTVKMLTTSSRQLSNERPIERSKSSAVNTVEDAGGLATPAHSPTILNQSLSKSDLWISCSVKDDGRRLWFTCATIVQSTTSILMVLLSTLELVESCRHHRQGRWIPRVRCGRHKDLKSFE